MLTTEITSENYFEKKMQFLYFRDRGMMRDINELMIKDIPSEEYQQEVDKILKLYRTWHDIIHNYEAENNIEPKIEDIRWRD